MLGAIDRSTLAAQERIRDEVDSVDEDLVRSRIILVVTVVVASVLLMLLALMLVLRIVAPLVQLQEEMARVAVMNLSQVDETRAISNIEEVGHMQTSFLQMLRNLKEYRNYMPASVLVDDVSDTQSGSCEISTVADRRTCTTTSLSESSRHSGAVKHTLLMTQKLDLKKVAFSVVNVCNFFQKSREHSSREMQSYHTEYLSTVLGITHGFNGVNDGFLGDRVMTHWNGARHCTSPKLQAAKFSRRVHSDEALLKRKWTLSMAFVFGEVRCGNMGCQGMKKFTFLGGCVPWLHVLERFNKEHGTTILHDNVMNLAVDNSFYSKTVTTVSYPKFQETLIISELREEMTADNEEWMYQLEKCDSSNPYKDYNTAMTHLFAAQWDECEVAARKLHNADREGLMQRCSRAKTACVTEYRPQTVIPILNL